MSIPSNDIKWRAGQEAAEPYPSADGHGADVPIYSKIQEDLRGRIQAGEYKPGDRVPSESELCRLYQTTRTTVRQALTQLVFEGIVVRHVGRGSFVASTTLDKFPIDTRECLSFEDQVALEGRVVTYQSPSFNLIKAPPEVSRDLDIEPGSNVFYMERLRVLEERPVCLECRYIHEEFGRHVTGDMLMSRSAHGFVSDIMGTRIPTIRVLVSAIIADKELAERLSVTAGSALIVRDNWHIDSEGRILMCGKSLFPGDIRTEYVLGKHSALAKPVTPLANYNS